MAKNIVFCADGTWNGPESQTGQSILDSNDVAGEIAAGCVTNVVKLFANMPGQVTPDTMRLSDEQEKVLVGQDASVVQVMKYIHGVGDSSNPIIKAVGGVFGAGLIARVVRGYTFISRNYVPGDKIYICGFSRGAYTARALAGLICRVALLNSATYNPDDKEAAYKLGLEAWMKSKSMALQGSGLLVRIGNEILNLAENVLTKRLASSNFVANVPIQAVAVWDTVGSLGIPKYAGDQRIDVLRFVDTTLNDLVSYGFHAMAIDERRADFPVTRWTPRKGVEEVWFTGAHADVGGGYPEGESRLSDEALSWMISKLSQIGVRFTAPLVSPPQPASSQEQIHTPWTKPPFNSLEKADRQANPGDTLHASVVKRWRENASYRPASLGLLGQDIEKCKVDSTACD